MWHIYVYVLLVTCKSEPLKKMTKKTYKPDQVKTKLDLLSIDFMFTVWKVENMSNTYNFVLLLDREIGCGFVLSKALLTAVLASQHSINYYSADYYTRTICICSCVKWIGDTSPPISTLVLCKHVVAPVASSAEVILHVCLASSPSLSLSLSPHHPLYHYTRRPTAPWERTSASAAVHWLACWSSQWP